VVINKIKYLGQTNWQIFYENACAKLEVLAIVPISVMVIPNQLHNLEHCQENLYVLILE
jgi:hypothetical protein